MLALSLDAAKHIAIVVVVVLVVFALVSAAAIKSVVMKLVSVLVLAGLALGVWTQRSNLEDCAQLVKDRGVAVAQAARDLDVHENVLRKWVRDLSMDPQHAFPGHGQMKPEQLEIDRLRKEVAKLKAERDILKKAAAFFAREAI